MRAGEAEPCGLHRGTAVLWSHVGQSHPSGTWPLLPGGRLFLPLGNFPNFLTIAHVT